MINGTIEPSDIIHGKMGAGTVRYIKGADLHDAIDKYMLEHTEIPAPTKAEVGQTIRVTAVDGDGRPTAWEAADLPKQVQADWNQNDSTAADYVKNRPFYESDPVETEIVEQNTFAFSNEEGFMWSEFLVSFEAVEGGTYLISWDGNEYECILAMHKGVATLGNFSILSGENDTGEPFLFAFNLIDQVATAAIVASNDSATEHVIGIKGHEKEIIRIGKKYLPPTIPYMVDNMLPIDYVLPNVSDLFGGSLQTGGTEAEKNNFYRNKRSLNLTLEKFNDMLDGTFPVPKFALCDGNLARIIIETGCIEVLWNRISLYGMAGSYGYAGASIKTYSAKIHEDDDNPGTIVSEYGFITVVDKRLS